MKQPMTMLNDEPLTLLSNCPICERTLAFSAPDDYVSCRGKLRAPECPFGSCATRDRAIAKAIFSIFPKEKLTGLSIHEAAPSSRGLTVWLQRHCPGYVQSGYFPDQPRGSMVGRFRNEDLEAQTFADEEFDLVFHLDVLEHLFNPFKALAETFRTLKPGGFCILTAPTYPDRLKSEQVAFIEADGSLRHTGVPEYHGNPQHPEAGVLVTWRYGYDLPLEIARRTGFDVEVRRWQSRSDAILGPMTEVYLLGRSQ